MANHSAPLNSSTRGEAGRFGVLASDGGVATWRPRWDLRRVRVARHLPLNRHVSGLHWVDGGGTAFDLLAHLLVQDEALDLVQILTLFALLVGEVAEVRLVALDGGVVLPLVVLDVANPVD